jgi:SAM-dependent methyltransferase
MPLRSYLKRVLPAPYVEAYRVARRVARGQSVWPPADLYGQLYERHALASSDSDAVGLGSFEHIGRMELALLRQAGLQPSHTLVDFGCGTGRLAVHAIPALPEGRYIGIDISQEMLRRLESRLQALSKETCRVSLVHGPSDPFPLADASVDMLCAFSVFTHMEHEDSYRYLLDARRVVRRGGRIVFSCLPIDSLTGQGIFKDSASVDLQRRWATPRSVVTSRDFMTGIAELAGWRLADWIPGDEEQLELPGQDRRFAFGQSIAVLE